jgi:glycosyltransferase involved in cell wall biosynthesis
MAWNDALRNRYKWHKFGPEWELLPAAKIPAVRFLQSLDLFVYPLGHNFKESWGRSTVEAMLTGCIPLVPTGHQFENFIIHEDSGFICRNFEEYQFYAKTLSVDYSLQLRVSSNCAERARKHICNREEHRQRWIQALTF